MTTTDEPLMRTSDLPDTAPYAAPLIDLLTNLHDEPDEWTVKVRHNPAALRGILPTWSISVTTQTHDFGKFAASVVRAEKEIPSTVEPGKVTFVGEHTDDFGEVVDLYIHAPAADTGLAEKVRDLVDEADLNGQHAQAEVLRGALQQLRGDAA